MRSYAKDMRQALEEDKFAASVRLEDGSTRSLPYEHVSKLS